MINILGSRVKQLILIACVFCVFPLFAQTDIGIKLGASPWNINHDNKLISKPVSVASNGALLFEQVLFKRPVALLTGFEYTYAPQGNEYIDLSDKQDIVAGIVTDQFNSRYLKVVHHEISVPLMFVFYHKPLRTGIGIELNHYYFPKKVTGNFSQFNDYGLKLFTGARFSRTVSFSIGYFYGLKDVFAI